MTIGRPTDYRPEMCEIVIREMKEGAAIEELPLSLNVVLSTLYVWRKKHPEFEEAIKIGEEYSKAWWLKKGRQNIDNKDFNHGLWFMNMKNRHRWHNGEVNVKHGAENGSLLEKIIDKL